MPAHFVDARRTSDGYRLRYRTPSGDRELSAGALVNAAGPWINHVRQKIAPEPRGLEVELVAGTHIEIEGEIARGIYYTEAPSDARAVFVMPWKDRILVGTTETRYEGDPREVRATAEEIEYLSATFMHYFPGRAVGRIDAWAGLRVLPKGSGSAFARPRETTLVCDVEHEPRMVAIYGGKLTGYRATAEKVVKKLARTLPRRERRADTRTLRLEAEGALELASKARLPPGQ